MLPSFSFIYTFPDVVVAGERCSRSFECLDVEQQEILEDIIEHGSMYADFLTCNSCNCNTITVFKFGFRRERHVVGKKALLN